ncbi:anti-sigma factor antagonist [Leptospira andrefontaineae]|uniref:Anti-sigma factor antagonist n=2 Tax=Leptospira andrefontaineae TaxID=2484976 RepID=A0A4R9H0G3_9LEPT|nr:anti-sigma factor antagonist [Leptospira andrefontaineae]
MNFKIPKDKKRDLAENFSEKAKKGLKSKMGENSEIIEIQPELTALFNDYYAFRNQLMDAIAKKPAKIVLDLGKIPVMNSISISSLVWFCKNAKLEGIAIDIREIHPDLMKTFEVLKIDEYFQRI